MATELEFVPYSEFVENLPEATDFAAGDKTVLAGSTVRKMDKDVQLQKTAENALAGNVALAFDATRTIDNLYKRGEKVEYKGFLYVFKNEHYGAWNASDVTRITENSASVESVYKIIPNATYETSSSSSYVFSENYDLVAYVRVNKGDVLTINVGAPGCYVRLFAENDLYYDYFSFVSEVERTVKVDNGGTRVPRYAMIPVNRLNKDSAFIKINGNLVFSGKENSAFELFTKDIQGGQFQNVYFEGNDSAFTSNRFYNKLVAGHRYRAYLLCPDFVASSTDPTAYKLILRPLYSGWTTGDALFSCRVNDTASPYYDFVMPNDTYSVLFGGRAAKGKLISMKFVDLSIAEYKNDDTSRKVVLSKSLINSSVSSGYPDYDSSTTRVCSTDIVLFPKSGKTTYKLTAPSNIQFSASVFNGAQNVQTGYVIGWKSDGAVFSFDTDSTKCYAFRPSFRRANNADITAVEVLQMIEEGSISIDVVGDVDIDYSLAKNYTAVSSAKKKLITSSPWCKQLPLIAHISDIHGDITRLKNSRTIADFFGVDALVNSGDSVMYTGAARADYLKDFSSADIPLIFCVGNHEVFPDGSATQTSIFADFISPLVTENGYMKNSVDPADSPFYYRDIDGKKLRIIALNYYNNGKYTGSLGQAQLDWFVQTLASTPQDYGVIVVVHSPEDKIICPDQFKTFYQKERVVTYQENGFYIGNRPVMQIIDAFISKTSGVETYTTEADGEVSVAYDFTSLNSGVEFICYMTGHRHEDWVGYYSNATNKQLSLGITTGCALNSMYNNTAWNNQSDLGRGDGSGPAQDAVNIYAIDRDKGEIRIVRIGANITTSLEERNVLIIPYRD